MSDSTPTLPPTVLVPTLLTRPLYSQLVLQRFYAPKVFEKAGWTSGTLGKDDERRRSVGMKIVRSLPLSLLCSPSEAQSLMPP